MQAIPPTLKKWNEIKGQAAVSMDTGKKVGTVEDFYFNPKTSSIVALLVKTSLLGHRVLPGNAISAIGTDAVAFTNENLLDMEGSHKELLALPQGHTLLNYRVLSKGGNVLGNIGNILCNVETPGEPRVAAFELAGDLRSRLSNKYQSIPADKIVSYGHMLSSLLMM
ncbi:MAG TPA: PRC-barrel domain-containing protein [Ktedonobacteraceae bacterium]|jgi:uncharacterized protein YrrD|nr:PRC-barrel domain-containing protein [Ktedonobacteraceae bacterium]